MYFSDVWSKIQLRFSDWFDLNKAIITVLIEDQSWKQTHDSR